MASKPNFHSPAHILAFGFGSGLAPKAPGTVGSIAALCVWWLVLQNASIYTQLSVVAAGFFIGIYVCHQCAKDLGVHDYSGIVWDEWIGLWLVYLCLPASTFSLFAGLLLFRLFDILKPFPISWLDKHIDGGLGIMLDDILAAVFALAATYALLYFLPIT